MRVSEWVTPWKQRKTVRAWSQHPSEAIVDRDNHLRDCAKYIVLSLPGPSEVPIEITREKIVEDAFRNGTYPTLGVQLARFKEQDRRNNEAISYRPRLPIGIDDSYR